MFSTPMSTLCLVSLFVYSMFSISVTELLIALMDMMKIQDYAQQVTQQTEIKFFHIKSFFLLKYLIKACLNKIFQLHVRVT